MLKKFKARNFKKKLKVTPGGIKDTIFELLLEGKTVEQIYNHPKLADWKAKGKEYDQKNYIEYVQELLREEGLLKK